MYRSLFPTVLLLALAACGGERADAGRAASTEAQPAPAVDAEAGALPAGWRRVAGDDVPEADGGTAQQLPATVRSDDGVEVTVTDSGRLIAGGDDVIAVVEALGLAGQVYAAPRNSTTRAGRAAPRQFLFNRDTGVEGVLSLDGTLFVGNSLRRHSVLSQRLRETGLPAVIVDDLQPAPDKVRKVAAALGMTEAGERLAERVQAQLDRAEAIAAESPARPRVIQVSATGAGGQPTVAGYDNAAAQLIRLAGGVNVGDEAGVGDYSVLSNEGVVATAPDVILVTENDLTLFGGAEALWTRYPTLRQTPAGAADRVWVMPDLQLKSTSVASGAGAVALAEALAGLAAEPR